MHAAFTALSGYLQSHIYNPMVDILRTQPLYAVINGFEPDDVPGVGTFYYFINRLWKLDTNNISSHIKFPKRKPSNPPKKGILFQLYLLSQTQFFTKSTKYSSSF